MYYSTSRVLAILDLLQTHGRMRGEDLAARLEVDARTIRRYVMILRDRGIPVEMVRGRHGGYALPAGYTRPLALTREEALAVTYGFLGGGRERLGVVDGKQTLKKVMNALPAPTRELIERLHGAVTFVTPGKSIEIPRPPAVLDAIAQAIHARTRLALRYRSWSGDVTEREVDPYHVVERFGRWYLVGWCHLRSEQRVFRLEHILHARALTATFQPPAIDAPAIVEESLIQTPWAWEYRVLVMMPLDELRERVPAATATLTPQGQGVLMHGFIEDLDWLAHFLAGLRCPIRIMEPPELRAELVALAEHIQSLLSAMPPG